MRFKERGTAVSAAVVAVLAVAALAAPSCRRASAGKGEILLGHQEAVYLERDDAAGGRSKILALEASAVKAPTSIGAFTRLDHLPPSGTSGNAWAAAAASFFESEAVRQGCGKVKLSEAWLIYWERVEEARSFVKDKGRTTPGSGSLEPAVQAAAARHGLVRESDYPFRAGTDVAATLAAVESGFRACLDGLKAKGDWDESRAESGARAVLDRALGRPPESVSTDAGAETPVEYMRNVLKLKPEDYVCFMSFKYAPFYAAAALGAPGRASAGGLGCLNLPLHEFYQAFMRALRRGYTAIIVVDVTEPGFMPQEGLAVVPSFDIPRNFIDQSSRELRFADGSTSADRAVHCVGYTDAAGENWFLMKDAGREPSKHPGYYFYRDDYIRLKALAFMVHKDAVREMLGKFGTGK